VFWLVEMHRRYFSEQWKWLYRRDRVPDAFSAHLARNIRDFFEHNLHSDDAHFTARQQRKNFCRCNFLIQISTA